MIARILARFLSWLSPYDPPTGEALGWKIVEAQIERTSQT